ncbi:MAG: bifunctional oligoribonuclease/PAP phosphatase NrnA [Clostridia bacterium]|nr:bifunctional oligoribonuclease/PAP phosphatase NrnA [Clostridia bacterium]
MAEKINYNKAAQLLAENDNFLILTHAQPDGDTVGSGYGLCFGLQSLGKKSKVVCSDKIPDKYGYILKNAVEDDFEPQCVVAVDVADIELLGKYKSVGERALLCIDHHSTNKLFAQYTLLDTGAAAAENVYLVLRELGVEITPVIADCIFTGISTDTGCFMYMNVTPRTHRIAADLIEYGANAGMINQLMFDTKKYGYVMLQKLALDGLEMHFDNQCALIVLTKDMMKKCGISETEVEGIAAMPRQIEGVLAGITLRERSDGSYKVSMRTRDPIDASAICGKLGGGGHKRASGCQLYCGVEQAKATILELVGSALEES